MKSTDIFPSKYVKADDLNGKDVSVVIDRVTIEKIGDDQKPVVYFRGKEKGMVCNKTNWTRISYLYGDESDDWTGKPVVLTSEFVEFQGTTKKGLRIRPPTDSPLRSAVGTPIKSENPGDF